MGFCGETGAPGGRERTDIPPGGGQGRVALDCSFDPCLNFDWAVLTY